MIIHHLLAFLVACSLIISPIFHPLLYPELYFQHRNTLSHHNLKMKIIHILSIKIKILNPWNLFCWKNYNNIKILPDATVWIQFTPGLGVCPFKNNSLHVKNLIGAFSGVTAVVGFSVDSIEKSLDNVVTSNSSVIIIAITKTFQNL